MNKSPAPSRGDNQPGLPEGFDVNRPQRGARDGYYYDHLETNREYRKIISSMQGTAYDPRLRRMVRFMISQVSDDNLQLWLWNLLDSTEQNIDNDQEITSEDKRSEMKMDLYDLIVGHITAYYDQFVGVTHRLKAGVATPPPGMENDEPLANITEQDIALLKASSEPLVIQEGK